MGPVFEKLDPDQSTTLKTAVTALQEQLRVQEPKAAKQARLQSVMAQGQAKRAKLKALKETTRSMRLDLEAAEQKIEDLEEEVQRLDQEEKILCSEVQEAEEPPEEETEPEEDAKHPKGDQGPGHPKGSPEAGPDQNTTAEFQQLLQQLHGIVQGMGQRRKKARSELIQAGDSDDNMAGTWGADP